ncbi:Crp/Fnr family transcriptional regulator [Parasphingopyxis sp. GrpM-11]|uniref:Crp/Fnr family transcriptional regulator n=1 Tax=Parasphingopyxis marina TaxID=2761622 RepID=A0A842HVM7_9SPHN|nr:Crp/Fnr family transcriptional regulator [Parasphingopyxis marina]
MLHRFSDGATIQQRGQHKPGLSIIAEGSVQLSATDAEGERTSYTVLRPGDCFGEMTLLLDIPRTLDATALGETAIREVPRDRFFRLLDDQPALRDHLLVGLARQLSQALQLLDDQRRLPAEVRMAKALAALARTEGEGHVVRASQTALAEAIATSRVTAGKALQALAADGLAETAYGRVLIPDIARLKAWIAGHSALAPVANFGGA